MDLNDYFDPVSLDPPEVQFLEMDQTFAGQVRKHTPDQPIPDPKEFRLALVGLPEERSSRNKGCAAAPDHIRKHLYQLSRIPSRLPILDLGNLKPGKNPVDTYYGIREVTAHLLSTGTCPVFIGGSQDLTYGIYLAYKSLEIKPSLVTVDSRVDFSEQSLKIESDTYLQEILLDEEEGLFHFTNLGHQVYFLSQQQQNRIKELQAETIGIGQIRGNLKEVEPVLRDADIVSLDISSIKKSDAPGFYYPSPNGFYSEEICQLAKYAGASNRISSFGVFETNPTLDIHEQTSMLAAQILWYFIEGFSGRREEFPGRAGEDFTKYLVSLSDQDQTLVFYKSLFTDRWWLEVPVIRDGNPEKHIIACSYEDYLTASQQELPDRWLRFYRKLN